jgi:hypothetical protein
MSEEKHLIKTKNDLDYTEIVRTTYIKLNSRYGSGARINRIFEMIKYMFDLPEFLALQTEQIQNAQFESWLLDRQLDWIEGRPVDFREVYDAILTAGDFIETEKRLFEFNKIEERIWAIFLAVCDPKNTNKIN